MKKLSFAFLFLTLNFIVPAQDVIYTISGEIDQQKTSLDSILVENLSNNTRILIDNLPELEYYQINLSKNAFWGTVGINSLKNEAVFVETHNTPGLVQFKYQGNTQVKVRLSVFNVNGQMVYTSEHKTMFPGNSIKVQLAATGVYFVQIQSPIGNKTFKAIGSDNKTSYAIEITENTATAPIFKSSFLVAEDDFSFMIGDSLRISAYKTNLYVRPIGNKIIESESFNFKFDSSQVVTSGISDAYIELDNSTSEIVYYNNSSGFTKIHFTGERPEFYVDNIIVVDVDTMGYLRKIVSSELKGDTTILQTEQACLNDVFVNKEFKIHSGIIPPNSQLKSSSTWKDLEKAFTDDKGYIHPYKVIYHNTDGTTFTKSAHKMIQQEEERVRLYEIYRDLKMDLKGTATDNVHLYVDEGHLSFFADAVFEFGYTYEGEFQEDTKIKEGELNYFNFYLEGNLDFLSKIALDLNYSSNKEETQKLIDIQKVTQVYNLGIPIWITFDCDIYGYYNFVVDASFHADWGFETNHNVKIGGIYDRKNDSFEAINEYIGTTEIYPLNTEGEVSAFTRVEIYPRSEVKFYDFYGPISEIVPYVEGRYNGAFQTVTTSQGTESFLAWDSNLQLGLDFAVGSELTFLFNINKSFDVITYPVWKELMWAAPAHLSLASNIPEEVNSGEEIILTFDVLDRLYKPVYLCPVYISGDGSFDKQIAYSDINGQFQVKWTVGNDKNLQSFVSTIFRADKTMITSISKSVNVSIISKPNVSTSAASVITETSARLNGNVWSDGGSTIIQRGFYWSQTNTNPGPTTGGTQKILLSGTTGSFNKNISNLKPNTKYYYRAFATNAQGTSTGSVESFTTKEEQNATEGTFTDSRDGKTYKWIKIGEQVWMAENLAYLPIVNPPSSYSYTESRYYVYDYSGTDVTAAKATSNFSIYGVLYNWPAAMASCPDGWHLPSDEEWTQLENYLADNGYNYDGTIGGGKEKIAKSMAAKTQWDYSSITGAIGNDQPTNNRSGFSALPGGISGDDNFYHSPYEGYWWSSTESSSNNAWYRLLYSGYTKVIRSNWVIANGISVRCLRD